MKKITYLAPLLALVAAAAFADTNPPNNTEIDNSGINKRDANADTLVPTDQSRGSKSDVELTRRIRELVVKDDTLSSKAHNVKIITIDGIATLRGPVESAAERQKIASLASQVVGAKAVKNNLEVKAVK